MDHDDRVDVPDHDPPLYATNYSAFRDTFGPKGMIAVFTPSECIGHAVHWRNFDGAEWWEPDKSTKRCKAIEEAMAEQYAKRTA